MKFSVALTAVAVVITLLPVRAQVRQAPPTSSAPTPQVQARHEIMAFETVLENAVNYGAQSLMQHVFTSATPEQVLLTGQARARGFRLDGYGVVFDVEFPSIRRTVAWTMRTLEQDRVNAYNASGKGVSVASAQMAPPSPPVDDPRAFYSAEMVNALITAIVDQGSVAGVGPDEWLTVAARESLDLRFMPDDPATTLIMRVRGSDLAALREKRLTREDAIKRIEVKQY